MKNGHSKEDQQIMHKTIQKVSSDIESISFNTAIAALMEWLNHLSRKAKVSKEEYKTFLLLLAPFAPHITEELWQMLNESNQEEVNDFESVHNQPWPKFDEKYLKLDVIQIVIQINGKVRDTISILTEQKDNQEMLEKQAIKRPRVAKFLAGKQPKKVIYVPGKILNIVI